MCTTTQFVVIIENLEYYKKVAIFFAQVKND